MRRLTMFLSTTDRTYDGGPKGLKYDCIKIAYSIQYSNMLCRFVT